MVKQFITIKEAKRRGDLQGMAYKTKINKVNVVVGFVCVAYGGATLLLPTGSIFAIMGGLGLMFNPIPINRLIKNLYTDVLFKLEMWGLKW